MVIPMFRERVKILNEIGFVLSDRYDGEFYNFLRRSDRAFDRGRGLVEMLAAEFRAFNDVRIYKPTGTLVKFYKKAQLLLSCFAL